jgi:hypothetical protein
MLVPPEVSVAMLAAEFPSAASWAGRHGWDLVLDASALAVTAKFNHPAGGRLTLVGGFDDYPALPPSWRFVDEAGDPTPAAWPLPGSVPGLSSIFIRIGKGPVICAHFNRHAYADYGGPHGNWGGASRWRDVEEGAKAMTLGDMLAVVARHVAASAGRMG